MPLGRAGVLLGLMLAVAPVSLPEAAAQAGPVAQVAGTSGATSYQGWTWRARPLFTPFPADTVTAPPDRWLGQDKALHAGGSFVLTLATHLALTGGGANEAEALPFAAGSALFLGVMKEVADRSRPDQPRFSLRDLTADAAGVLAAVAFVIAL